MSSTMPNKSPEPTAVGAVSSAFAGGAFSSAVAQLFSLGQIAHHYENTHTYLFAHTDRDSLSRRRLPFDSVASSG